MSALKGPSTDKGTDEGETIVIAITTHGAVLTQRTDAGEVMPENFETPVKLIKYSAVPFGVCNITEDKIIKNNIEHLIKEFRKLSEKKMSDEEIIPILESITQKYKDDHKRFVESVSESDIEEWTKSEKEIDKEKLGFFYNGHLGHTINTYNRGENVTEKAYTLGGISDEDARSGNAIYSDKILLFALPHTFDLYDQLAGDNPGVLLSDIIKTIYQLGVPISRIVIIDFTCNESHDPVTDEEKAVLRDESNEGRVRLGGKKNTKKSKKSRNKYKKIKKSRKSRRHK
jgi:hypothetical protein